MRKKKIMRLIATAVLAMLSAVTGIGIKETEAAETVKLEIFSVKESENNTISADVMISENPGISGITLGIRYDKSILEVAEVISSDEVFKSEAAVWPNGDGFVGYSNATGSGDYTATGRLMTIKFKIRDGVAAGDTALTIGSAGGVLEASNFAGETVAVTISSGNVTVEDKNDVAPDNKNNSNTENTGEADNSDATVNTDSIEGADITGKVISTENENGADNAKIPVRTGTDSNGTDTQGADKYDDVRTGDRNDILITLIFIAAMLSGSLVFMELKRKNAN